jgi:uncharacterized DUF497 family protein
MGHKWNERKNVVNPNKQGYDFGDARIVPKSG